MNEGHPKESPRPSRSRQEGNDTPHEKKRDKQDASQEKRKKDKRHDDGAPQKDGQHSSEDEADAKKGDMREYRAMLTSQLEEVMKSNAPTKGDTFEKYVALPWSYLSGPSPTDACVCPCFLSIQVARKEWNHAPGLLRPEQWQYFGRCQGVEGRPP